jgi:hypothetical protein
VKNECTFTFFGLEHTLKRNPRKRGGADYSAKESQIEISTKFTGDTFREYVHHELVEGALYNAGGEYGRKYPEDQTIFVFTHTELSTISSQVRMAYDEICRKMNEQEAQIQSNN